jgi:iron(III) transport system substrate-binding protein
VFTRNLTCKLAGLASAALLLAACSSGATPAGPSAASATGGQEFKLQPVSGFAAPPSNALIEAAKAEGGEVVWYESTPDNLIPDVVEGFTEKYPWARVTHVNLAGSLMNARVAQEVQAGAVSADVGTNDAAPELVARDMVLKVDWDEVGIPEGMPTTDYAVATAATIYCIQYNTNLVSEAEAPKTWDDLLDPKWKGKIGYYAQPYFFSQLVSLWGSEETQAYVDKFAAQEPTPVVDSAAVTEFLAAGDYPVALTVYQTYLRGQENGLPIGVNIPDPAAMTILYSYLPKTAAHPNTAKLFLNWLGSEEGQTAYMKVAKRGNPLYPDTEYGEIVAGKELASWGPEDAATQTEWLKTFQDQLQH